MCGLQLVVVDSRVGLGVERTVQPFRQRRNNVVGKVQGAPSAGAPELQAKFKKKEIIFPLLFPCRQSMELVHGSAK